MVTYRESAELAKRLIEESCKKQDIQSGQFTLHADRGTSMRSKPVALLLAALGEKTHSRPHVSDDNSFAESQFRTLKYRPGFPDRFGCIQDSRAFCQSFFRWYNSKHRHSVIGLLTPVTGSLVKRKTSCGNAKMCSILLSNVTRSASYEALPNHRLFPARSGLTSRFPFRKRCLWEKEDETAAIYCERTNQPEKRQKRGCRGPTELPIIVARRSWRAIFCGNWIP